MQPGAGTTFPALCCSWDCICEPICRLPGLCPLMSLKYRLAKSLFIKISPALQQAVQHSTGEMGSFTQAN